MEIKVCEKSTGKIYTNDMSDNNKQSILSLSFCTSYTQVEVQDQVVGSDGKKKYPTHDIILPPLGSKPNWIDLIATQDDPEGEWV